MAKPLDIDYLHISTRLRAMEKQMLTHDKLIRLLNCKADEDMLKLLCENGWQPFDIRSSAQLEEQISQRRNELFTLLADYLPDAAILDVFRLKYDYHNLKSLIKANALGIESEHLLSASGTTSSAEIKAAVNEKAYSRLPQIMASAAEQAAEILARTGDPQLCDMILDKAQAKQMLFLAEKSESEFLAGYIRLSIDLDNLRILCRCALAKKGLDFIGRALLEGGNIDCRNVKEANTDVILALFDHGITANAAQTAAGAIGEKTGLAPVDLACDNTLISYLKGSRLIPFGDATVIAHILATESQLTAVRSIVSGKTAGVDEQKIAERLRISYV